MWWIHGRIRQVWVLKNDSRFEFMMFLKEEVFMLIFKFYWYINYNYELNIFIECYGLSDPLSSTPKCGPNYGSRCNALIRTQDLYCNLDTGLCGGTLDYKDAQMDDSYDWDPKSCRSKNLSKVFLLHRCSFC